MKDYKLLIFVSFIFIQLGGIILPFYLPSDWGQLPFGMSFLADGVVLLFLGLLGWAVDVIEHARKEDELQNWLRARDDYFSRKDE